MSTIVQKFGGTSLATIEARELVIDKIINAHKEYENVIVVVSAMGRLGAPYATDSLLDLVAGSQTKLSNRELDMLISCGEIIAVSVIVNELKERGIEAEGLTGSLAGIKTDNQYCNAEVIQVDPSEVHRLLEQNKVVVVAGFQGRGSSGEVTTIGRGGSDLSALLIGEGVKADLVEIYTDVNGIMTADPNICDKAEIILQISYEDLYQMADSGAKVIHPKAVNVARRSGIQTMIKNTFNDHEGTLITWYNQVKGKSKNNQLVGSVTYRKNRIQFLVEGDINDEIFFKGLAENNVSIDMINLFPFRRVFTVDSICKDAVLKVLKGYDADYSFIDHCAKVTVVGTGMTGVPGVMAKIIKKLNEVDVKILQTADSLSTIGCLIKEEDLEKAICGLHDEFELKK